MSHLTDMAMDPKRAREDTAPVPADAPEYPYGLKIQLQDEDLRKLRLNPMPSVGQTMMLQAQVKVTDSSQRDTQGEGTENSLGLQILAMGLGPDTMGPPSKEDAMADRMYSKVQGQGGA